MSSPDTPADCVGRELTAVIESVHLYDRTSTLIELWLEFADALLHIRGNATGNELAFDSMRVGADYSMGRYGRVVHRDVSGADRFKPLVGRTLVVVDPIHADYQPGPIGVSLRFTGGGEMRLMHEGDELIVETEAP